MAIRQGTMQVLMKKSHAMVVPSSAAAQENEVKSMNRSATGVMTGLAVGLAAGTAMYAATNMTTARQRRKMKKAANRAMKNVEGIVSDMAYIMKP